MVVGYYTGFQTGEKATTFESICQFYKEYAILHYGRNTIVVFDGGYELPSTKNTTHLRRTKGRKGKHVRFNKQMKLSMKKGNLLNKSNKQCFLDILTAIQALGNADLLIVSTALDVSKKHPIAIVGEDTDLLALPLQHATEEHKISSLHHRNRTQKQNITCGILHMCVTN